MTPGEVRPEIVAERAAWARGMLAALRALPLASYEEFAADARNPAAAESYLRRTLGALLDLGRHLQVAQPELYEIGTQDAADIEAVLESMLAWTREQTQRAGDHPNASSGA